MPIQLAQCRFPGLAISCAEIIYFSNKIYGSEILIYFIWKQFYQTPLGNCYVLKLPKCRLQFKRKIIVNYYNFRSQFAPGRGIRLKQGSLGPHEPPRNGMIAIGSFVFAQLACVPRGVDPMCFFWVRTQPLFETSCLLLRLHPT